jgi:hypothetical protein
MNRVIATAKNRNFPLLSDGVHQRPHTPAECSAAGVDPRTAYGAGRAPLHLASLSDEELAQLVRIDLEATPRELELSLRILNLLDALEEAINTYKEVE